MDSGIEALKLMESAVLDAAQYLLQFSAKSENLQVNWKADRSMVMNLDLECQRRIALTLSPALPVAGEEDEKSHALIGGDGDYFLIDPIDGTSSCKRYLGMVGGQIGYGPLVGMVKAGRLHAASYFNLPTRTLYSALAGKGSYAWSAPDKLSAPELSSRRKLAAATPKSLVECALLFFPGSMQELKFVHYLRDNNLVENTYRLGAFANDCTRIAEGFEQVQLQVKVRAWDFSAALIAAEAGLAIEIDPFNAATPFADWRVSQLNPVLTCHANVFAEVKEHLQRSA